MGIKPKAISNSFDKLEHMVSLIKKKKKLVSQSQSISVMDPTNYLIMLSCMFVPNHCDSKRRRRTDCIQLTSAGIEFQIAPAGISSFKTYPAHIKPPTPRHNYTHTYTAKDWRKSEHTPLHLLVYSSIDASKKKKKTAPRRHAQAVCHPWCNYSLSAANLQSHLLTFSERQRLIHSQLRSSFSSDADISFSFVHHCKILFLHFLKH